MPPEVNTSRLMVGAGPAPMLQAAAGWEAFSILLETQADELQASLASLASAWSGAASERAVSATMPMVLWLRMTSLQAMKRSLQAAAQATAYSTALTTTPPLPEIETNRVTTQVLYDTNFFFVNTVPIGVNEVDYWVRMWTQAAVVMDSYAAETAMNTVFEPIMPLMPIVMPGVGEATSGSAVGMTAAMAPGALVREASFAHVTGQATVESVGLTTGRMVGQGNMLAERGEGAARQGAERRSAGRSAEPAVATRCPAGCPDGHADGVAAGLDAGPDPTADGTDGHPADAAADVTAAAGDLDVQRVQPAGWPDGGEPDVQPPAGRRDGDEFRRRVGAGGVPSRCGRHVGAHTADVQPRWQAGSSVHAHRAGTRRCRSLAPTARARRPSAGPVAAAPRGWPANVARAVAPGRRCLLPRRCPKASTTKTTSGSSSRNKDFPALGGGRTRHFPW